MQVINKKLSIDDKPHNVASFDCKVHYRVCLILEFGEVRLTISTWALRMMQWF